MDRRGFFKSILALGVAPAAAPLLDVLPLSPPVYAAPVFSLDELYAETWKVYRYAGSVPVYGWIRSGKSLRIPHASNT